MTIKHIFCSFIDAINAREWTALAGLVGPNQVTFNGRSYSCAEFLAKMEEHISALPDGKFEIDITISDEDAQVIGARTVYSTTPLKGKGRVDPAKVFYWETSEKAAAADSSGDDDLGETPRTSPSGVHHLFCWLKHDKVVRIEAIGDTEGAFSGEISLLNQHASADLSSSGQFLSTEELKSTYLAYIESFRERTVADTLQRFYHPTVTYNGKQFNNLRDYEDMIRRRQVLMPDVGASVQTVTVDSEQQRVAVLLEIHGTPAGEPAGGKVVRFPEIVFYWLSEGKIYKALVLVNWVAYRAQLRALGGSRV